MNRRRVRPVGAWGHRGGKVVVRVVRYWILRAIRSSRGARWWWRIVDGIWNDHGLSG